MKGFEKGLRERATRLQFKSAGPESEDERRPSRARINQNEKESARNQSCFKAKRQWMRRMPCVAQRLVAPSTQVRGVWAHRMLRQFSEPACIPACRGDGASDHRQLRAGRGLVLRLRDAKHDRGREVAPATFASEQSASSRAGRKSAVRLGIAAELACSEFL
jgi:hypothetical protein